MKTWCYVEGYDNRYLGHKHRYLYEEKLKFFKEYIPASSIINAHHILNLHLWIDLEMSKTDRNYYKSGFFFIDKGLRHVFVICVGEMISVGKITNFISLPDGVKPSENHHKTAIEKYKYKQILISEKENEILSQNNQLGKLRCELEDLKKLKLIDIKG